MERSMKSLFRYEFDVRELKHSAMQGWIWGHQEVLAEKLQEGWRVIGVTALGPQQIVLLLRRRRWRWSR
jgi:hypothetical protein